MTDDLIQINRDFAAAIAAARFARKHYPRHAAAVIAQQLAEAARHRRRFAAELAAQRSETLWQTSLRQEKRGLHGQAQDPLRRANAALSRAYTLRILADR